MCASGGRGVRVTVNNPLKTEEVAQAANQSIIELGSDEETKKEEPSVPVEDSVNQSAVIPEKTVDAQKDDDNGDGNGSELNEDIPPSGVITIPAAGPDANLETNTDGINACQTCDSIKAQRKRVGK